MTAPIDTQTRPILPDKAKPVVKAAAPSSSDIESPRVYPLPDSDLSPTQRPEAPHKTEDSDKVGSNVNDLTARIQAAREEDQQDDEESNSQNLDNAVQQLNDYAQSINRSLEFNLDEDSGKMVVKVMDSETDELIRQIPSEEALRIAKQINEKLSEEDPDNHGVLLQKLIA